MNTKLLYIDIETTKNGNIKDVGALFGEQQLHTSSVEKLRPFILSAEYICGHNIIAHDIPLLAKVLGSDIFQYKKIVDTLLWSPILFNENPYHKLVKGYKIVNEEELNNPLSDCILTQQLLQDQFNAFNKLSRSYQVIYTYLLGNHSHYKGLLQLMNISQDDSFRPSLIGDFLENKICDATNLWQIVEEHPVELAYVIALISANENSILPNWVRKTFPKTQHILDTIRFEYCGKESCHYCNTHLNPRKALQTYFGYDNFRKFDTKVITSLQERTVNAGLRTTSFVAVFPTGGGKSLTFQLPALLKGNLTRQLTVVISPLVSLMKDQVENLQKKFQITKAVTINGLLSPLERQEAIERIENGSAYLLYISPESLRSPTIFRILRQRAIARFVIDEAHCFSSWGQDFRIDYLYIGEFIKNLESERLYGRIPVSCFTATAKPQVIQDIKTYFQSKLGIQLKEFVTRAERTNLEYEVIDVPNPEHKKTRLLKLLEDCELPAIIYASRTKRVEEIYEWLENNGFEATYFHGKLKKEDKKLQMDAFMNDEKNIIVATSAFGMGVDKDDVKSVIHYNISDSLENYVQEAGRAGRKDSIRAKCYVLYNEDDLNKHFSLLQQTKINQKEIQQVWQAIKYSAKIIKRKKISKSALEIAQKAGWDTELKDLESRVKTSIAALEDRGFLKRKQNSPRVYANSLLYPRLQKAREVIHKSSTITDAEKEKCARVLQYVYKHDECRTDYLSDLTGLQRREVNTIINTLRALKILGDAKDLTAFISLVKSANGSRNILQRYSILEKELAKQLAKDIKISIRELNQKMLDNGIEKSSKSQIYNLLNYWEKQSFIKKTRTNKEAEVFEIKFKNHEALTKDIEWRHKLAVDVLEILENLYATQQKERENHDKRALPVGFSMLELKENNESSDIFGATKNYELKQYEHTLLFLNQIKSIQLEGGFMVYYNMLKIDDIDDSIRVFSKDHYEKMASHYLHKTEQIHIVGEYAKRKLQNYESAITFVNEYFSLPYNEFIQKYFPSRKNIIRRPVSPKRFKKVLGELDVDQTKILRDGTSKNILVLAGPGSGKTKVLVHKIASLLLLEDIKPEQFLMLTFSKAASLEFRERTYKLVPEYAGFIKITTFHGYCFQLLGQMGDLDKSQNVIKDCIKAIKNEEIDITSIENKSVLLLDEFQDVSANEWELIQIIIEKAGNIRVIAVGDDDQNIYEFRKSNNEKRLDSTNQHMKSFFKKFSATPYALTRNYRSTPEIVAFNNRILNEIPHRMKSKVLESVKKEVATTVKLVRYTSNHLEQSLVNHLIKDDYVGTKAVLVRTNAQALTMQTLLRYAGQKTKLIAGFEGFRVSDLFEIRSFTKKLQKDKNETGFILDTTWKTAKKQFIEQHEHSLHFETCKALISKFEKNYPHHKLLIDWYDYVREINMQDAINAENTAIIVATMHKAKGKEFDHVYVLLEDFKNNLIDEKRLLYVACSRAKQNLQLHCNGSFFDTFQNTILEKSSFQGITKQPQFLEVILNHKEVNLGRFKKQFINFRISKLNSGTKLGTYHIKYPENEYFGLSNASNDEVVLFSKTYSHKRHNVFLNKGYQLVSGTIEYLVYWYDQEEEKEYKIILPRLVYERSNPKKILQTID